MLALEVRLNGRVVALAGAEDLSVLSQTISAVGRLGRKTRRGASRSSKTDIHLNVGGLTARTLGKPNEHLNWLSLKPLKIGDEVEVRVISVKRATRPTGRSPADDNKRKDDQERRWFELARKEYFKLRGKYEKGAR